MEYFNNEVIKCKTYEMHKTLDNKKLKGYIQKSVLKNGKIQSDITIDRKWSGSMPWTFSDILELKKYFNCELTELLSDECIQTYFKN